MHHCLLLLWRRTRGLGLLKTIESRNRRFIRSLTWWWNPYSWWVRFADLCTGDTQRYGEQLNAWLLKPKFFLRQVLFPGIWFLGRDQSFGLKYLYAAFVLVFNLFSLQSHCKVFTWLWESTSQGDIADSLSTFSKMQAWKRCRASEGGIGSVVLAVGSAAAAGCPALASGVGSFAFSSPVRSPHKFSLAVFSVTTLVVLEEWIPYSPSLLPSIPASFMKGKHFVRRACYVFWTIRRPKGK